MDRFLFWVFFILPLLSTAQTTAGLVSYFGFENNSLQDAVDIQNEIVPQGNLEFDCGLGMEALRLPDGSGSFGLLTGPVNNRFGTDDFTLSFLFFPGTSPNTQILFSKRDSLCSEDNAITIRYLPQNGTVEADLRENSSKNLSFAANLPADKCWYQIALVRRANRVRFHINGERVAEGTNSTRLDLRNNGIAHLGYTFCPQVGEDPFSGRIDELRVYIDDLNDSEVASLYLQPDRILNPDNRIFLGQTVDVQFGPSCGDSFLWDPTDGVDDPTIPDPSITPTVDGQLNYVLQIQEAGETCIALDTMFINVINPDDLDCSEIFLPRAFTPNGSGPVENETFGISNPFAVEELISLEIFDQWGGRLFSTDDPFERWDGRLNGDLLNTQNVVYLLRWRCDGEELVRRGSISVLK